MSRPGSQTTHTAQTQNQQYVAHYQPIHWYVRISEWLMSICF